MECLTNHSKKLPSTVLIYYNAITPLHLGLGQQTSSWGGPCLNTLTQSVDGYDDSDDDEVGVTQ